MVDDRTSVQFAGGRALLRAIAVSQQPTYHGWLWLAGYAVDRWGRATATREVYVQTAGLRQRADDTRTVLSLSVGRTLPFIPQVTRGRCSDRDRR